MKLCFIILAILITNSLVLTNYVDARKGGYAKVLRMLKRKPSVKIIRHKETALGIIVEAAIGTIAGEAAYDALKPDSSKEDEKCKLDEKCK